MLNKVIFHFHFLYSWMTFQIRLLTNAGPVALAISIQKVKNPIWMGRLRIDENGNINDHILKQIKNEHLGIISHSEIGIDSSSIISKEFEKTTPKFAMEQIILELNGVFK